MKSYAVTYASTAAVSDTLEQRMRPIEDTALHVSNTMRQTRDQITKKNSIVRNSRALKLKIKACMHIFRLEILRIKCERKNT